MINPQSTQICLLEAWEPVTNIHILCTSACLWSFKRRLLSKALLLLLMEAKSFADFSNEFNNLSPLQWWGRVKVGWLCSDCWQNRTSGFGFNPTPDLSTKMGNQSVSSPHRESSRMPLFVSFFCLSCWTNCACFLCCLIIRPYS